MPRAKVSKAVVITLLACVIFAVIGGAVTVAWVIVREEEFKRDKERIEVLDRDIRFQAGWGAVARANVLIDEQNALVRKWPGRLPGRVERRPIR